MRPTPAVLGLLLLACSPGRAPDRDAPVGTHLELAPADAQVAIVDGAIVIEPYAATLVDEDGTATDVTADATFTLANPSFGNWDDAGHLTITGLAAGPTQVRAVFGDASGATGLTVLVKGIRLDGSVPPNAPALFDAATETGAHKPTIEYPADNVLLPPNLGELDVHWKSGGNNLFEISLHNLYVDLRIYKQALTSAFVTYSPGDWATLASPLDPLTLSVAGMDVAVPTTKSTSTAQQIAVTNTAMQGGVYYWAAQPQQGVFRYDLATPNVPPSSFFLPGQQPTTCIGCHTLSKDGSKMALTLDSGNGRGTIVNVSDGTYLVDYPSNVAYWNFATFTPSADKLVTVFNGAMVLRATAGGAVIAPIATSPGTLASMPELSADGTKLAYIENTQRYSDFEALNGTIVTRTFDDATNTFGPVVALVPTSPGAENYYPSWSPDGQWIVFTRTNGNSYANDTAQAWVVKADGSQPPIQLASADKAPNLMNSWARWAPFEQRYGKDDEPLFYITFSTLRPFGVRAKTGTQIWMTPFFPARAAQGMDPSGPAFRMPFQRTDTSNHIAQWTQVVVPIQKPGPGGEHAQ